MSLKIEIFPVRAESALPEYSEYRIGTGTFTVGIFTKIDIKSGLDYTEHVNDFRNIQLLLEKHSN